MWQAQWHNVIHKITLIPHLTELQDALSSLSQPQHPTTLAFVNAHAMNTLVSNIQFYEALLQADVIYRDGSGMAKLFQQLGIDPGLNLNGTDLIPQILARYSGRSIAFYGTQMPYLEQAHANLMAQGVLAADTPVDLVDGFQSQSVYVQQALENKPSLIVLAMGMPKQEQVAVALKAALDYPCLIVCGGAIIDFIGGKVQRAPLWMRQWGIEWVYRLLREPKRLFKRYVIGNVVFMARVRRFKGFSV